MQVAEYLFTSNSRKHVDNAATTCLGYIEEIFFPSEPLQKCFPMDLECKHTEKKDRLLKLLAGLLNCVIKIPTAVKKVRFCLISRNTVIILVTLVCKTRKNSPKQDFLCQKFSKE